MQYIPVVLCLLAIIVIGLLLSGRQSEEDILEENDYYGGDVPSKMTA